MGLLSCRRVCRGPGQKHVCCGSGLTHVDAPAYPAVCNCEAPILLQTACNIKLLRPARASCSHGSVGNKVMSSSRITVNFSCPPTSIVDKKNGILQSSLIHIPPEVMCLDLVAVVSHQSHSLLSSAKHVETEEQAVLWLLTLGVEAPCPHTAMRYSFARRAAGDCRRLNVVCSYLDYPSQ